MAKYYVHIHHPDIAGSEADALVHLECASVSQDMGPVEKTMINIKDFEWIPTGFGGRGDPNRRRENFATEAEYEDAVDSAYRCDHCGNSLLKEPG